MICLSCCFCSLSSKGLCPEPCFRRRQVILLLCSFNLFLQFWTLLVVTPSISAIWLLLYPLSSQFCSLESLSGLRGEASAFRFHTGTSNNFIFRPPIRPVKPGSAIFREKPTTFHHADAQNHAISAHLHPYFATFGHFKLTKRHML